MHEVGEDDHEESCGVLEGVGEVREHLLSVLVTPETLREPEPGWEAGYY